MYFNSAIRQLRNSTCAKTPGMTGYVKREDYVKGTAGAYSDEPGSGLFADFSAATSYAKDAYVWHDGDAWRFTAAHYGEWTGDDVARVTGVYDVTFVENAAFSAGDGDSDGVGSYAFRAVVDSERVSWTAPSADLVLDAYLWGLMLADDWDVFDLASVEGAVNNSRRW